MPDIFNKDLLMYIRKMIRLYFFLILIFKISFSYSQGDKNLYKQYRTGPDPDNFFHKWNYSLSGKLNFMNSDQDYTKIGMGKGLGAVVQRLSSKSFGFSLGIEFNEINYKYEGYFNDSKDNLEYLSVPFSIRLYPNRKLFIEAGIKYHYLLSAKNSQNINPLDNSNNYLDGLFNNSIGPFIGFEYQVWKRLCVGIHYQYLKSTKKNQIEIYPNIFNGVSLKIGTFLKNPYNRPKEKLN